jgi:hypothetical protein
MQFVSFWLQPMATTSWKAIGQEIVSESKINFARHAILCFLLIGHGHVTTKTNVTIQSHYELNKLYFFHVENETNLNFPSIRHVPTNPINFTKSCWVTYYNQCVIYTIK